MSLLNGAGCSSQSNPLAQFNKHAKVDRSVQQDRIVTPTGLEAQIPLSRALVANKQQIMTQDDQQLMMSIQGSSSSSFSPPAPEIPTYKAMSQELSRLKLSTRPLSHCMSSSALDFHGTMWTQEFAHVNSAPLPTSMSSVELSSQASVPQAHDKLRLLQPRHIQPLISSRIAPAPQLVDPFPKEDWEAQFERIESQEKEQQEQQPQLYQRASPRYESDAELDLDTHHLDGIFQEQQFEEVWQNLHKSTSHIATAAEAVKTDDSLPSWDREFSEFAASRPNFGAYEFEPKNPFLQEPDPFAIGVQLIETGARLSSAALAFEAAVQLDPTHVEAWARLGEVQAQNEKEELGIRALERCISLDPGNLNALLNLSVSYTNDGYENAAYVTLERWLATKYPQVAEQARTQEPGLANENRFQLHSRVTELFIRAAQLSPEGASMDADVQIGLGVLFYGDGHYDRAVDCFRAALAMRPTDHLLWNRLGATLANSTHTELAVDAYSRALELRPTFVRARYNLGVSCINIGCYKEAAEHLLTAFSMHRVSGENYAANGSSNLMETLKRVFLALDRRDLVEQVSPSMDLDALRADFNF